MSERPAWLTPDFVYKGIGSVLLVAALYWGIVHRVDSLGAEVNATAEKVNELNSSIREIRQSLPNREANELIIQGITGRVGKLESEMEKQATYLINLRERLAEKGWRP